MIWSVAENTVVWISAAIHWDSSQTAAPLFILRSNLGKWQKPAGSANICKTELGTCGVYSVSIRLKSTASLHTDTHILPLRQSALGREVAGNIWRHYCLIWEWKTKEDILFGA